MTKAFQPGQKFKLKRNTNLAVFTFEKIVFIGSVGEIHCVDDFGNEVILADTYLSDLEHVPVAVKSFYCHSEEACGVRCGKQCLGWDCLTF
jgi:hypothetical protein